MIHLGTAIPATHPARLAAFAIAHGLRAALGARFRYLELGCGDAANVLPIAAQFPEARFFALDKNAEAIARGEALRREAGLDNVELRVADLRDDLPIDEPYDFVVSHGVYSWVAPDVQARLLALCAGAVGESGVAYLSYNCLPGWAMRGVVRDVMRAASAHGEEDERLRAAKIALKRLQRHVRPEAHPYCALLASEVELALQQRDSYVLSEHLAERNEALYVRELLSRAAEHGLQLAAETLPATPDGELELSLLPELESEGLDRLQAEQQLDILCYRQFRGTLLCSARATPSARPSYRALAEEAYFAGDLRVLSEEPLLGPDHPLRFGTDWGVTVEATRPLLKAALLTLAQRWPEGLRARELTTAALGQLRERGLLERCPIDDGEIGQTLQELMLLCRRRLLELLPWTPPLGRAQGERPCATRVARAEARRSATVTLPRHSPLALDPVRRLVLQRSDGSRDRAMLVSELRSAVDAEELSLPENAAAAGRPALEALVDNALQTIAAYGLLEP